MSDEYTGTEPATTWNGRTNEPAAAFVVRPPGLPASAVPLYDDEERAVIGYRWESVRGVYRIYDLNGEMVGMTEDGLETPLLDPIDLIFLAGGLVRALGRASAGVAARATVVGGMRALIRTLGAPLIATLRASLRQLVAGEIKFTATTAAHMAEKGRYVPVHILRLAIRHGTRVADTRGAAGAFQYTTQMFKNGVPYTLKVVLREADNTILHFHYFR
jgi:hypothetical protein